MQAYRDVGIEPLLAIKQECHHLPLMERFAPVMGWRQMSMRGLDKAQGEWNPVTMVVAIAGPRHRMENNVVECAQLLLATCGFISKQWGRS